MNNDGKIEFNAEFDLKEIADILNNAADLNDNEAVFAELAKIQRVKNQLGDLSDKLKTLESVVKGAIQEKARGLYGDDWTVVKGFGYKITRSPTGAKYEQIGGAEEQFIVIKQSVNSEAVDDYVKANSELPEGIAVNAKRGSSLRITVHEEDAE